MYVIITFRARIRSRIPRLFLPRYAWRPLAYILMPALRCVALDVEDGEGGGAGPEEFGRKETEKEKKP